MLLDASAVDPRWELSVRDPLLPCRHSQLKEDMLTMHKCSERGIDCHGSTVLWS